MPNWCKGNIRFRGALKDIRTLLEHEIRCVGTEPKSLDSVVSKPVIQIEYGELSLLRLDERKDLLFRSFYINGTRRNFLGDGDLITAYGTFDEDDEREVGILLFDNFSAAWGIEAEPYVEMANKYNVDIHIFGWECGMEFAQEIEIVNGQLEQDREIHYDDWGWECPLPHVGG